MRDPADVQRLQELERQLEVAQRGLSDFAYTVSHDLKANLRHIKAYLDIVREELGDDLGSDVNGYLDVVTDAAVKMGQQMDGLMALAQIDRAALEPSTLAMNCLIDDARQSLANLAQGREVQWQIATDFPALLGDSSMVRQVWAHLLHNALKFTRCREVARLELGWLQDDTGVWCFVQDNGQGFAPSQQGKLFKVFQKLHTGDDSLGMGLALTRKLVERQGGQVQARSVPDQGSWFGFSLPSIS